MNKLLKHAESTGWHQPETHAVEVYNLYIPLILHQSNGKKFHRVFFTQMSISKKTKSELTATKYEELKKAKENKAAKILSETIDRLQTKRTGIRGLKGYFKFIKVEPHTE